MLKCFVIIWFAAPVGFCGAVLFGFWDLLRVCCCVLDCLFVW